MTKQLVSIGVTCFGRVELLKESLQLLLAQSYPYLEILIGNDDTETCLTYESLGVRDSRVKIYNHKTNLGELDNMNFLLQQSQGAYFTWLADDDLFHVDFILAAMNAFDLHESAEVFFSNYCVFKNSPDLCALKHEEAIFLNSDDFLMRYFKGISPVISVYGVFKRDALIRIGGMKSALSDGITLYGEYMLLMDLLNFDIIIYSPLKLVYYRFHENSWGVGNSKSDYYLEAAKVLLDYVDKEVPLRDNSKSLVKKTASNYFFKFCFNNWLVKEFIAKKSVTWSAYLNALRIFRSHDLNKFNFYIWPLCRWIWFQIKRVYSVMNFAFLQ